MSNRDSNAELMAHWMQAWTTLGRWQALNSRLSAQAAPLRSGWARRSSRSCRWPGVPAAVSTPRFMP
jgi:hypothetical protein